MMGDKNQHDSGFCTNHIVVRGRVNERNKRTRNHFNHLKDADVIIHKKRTNEIDHGDESGSSRRARARQ
jgi:hypothetical protein